ncbi:MAG: pyrimidine 5'-nucleotidase [Burkholderiaceae bacterium]
MSAPVWFFDLDNTLHNASHRIFGEMNRSMSSWLVTNLALDQAEADRLRIEYWHRYGTTLDGLMRHHTIDAKRFLNETHAFVSEPHLGELVRAEAGLSALFRKLPGRKVLITNAPAVYTRKVLKEIGLARMVHRRYHIEQMRIHGRYRPKPSRNMLRMLLAKEKVHPSNAVLIEDNLANLKSARAVGMHGVYVRGYDRIAQRMRSDAHPRCLSGIALRVESVTDLIRRRRFLR